METKRFNAVEITWSGMNNLFHNYRINIGMIKNDWKGLRSHNHCQQIWVPSGCWNKNVIYKHGNEGLTRGMQKTTNGPSHTISVPVFQ